MFCALLCMVTTQALAETLSGNLNPFKNKDAKKVGITEFQRAVTLAANGDQTEWKKLVDYDFVAYIDLVATNINTSAKTYTRQNIVYMLEHSILLPRKVAVGERVFGRVPSGGSDFYLNTKEFDDMAIVYSDTIREDGNGNPIVPNVVQQNDLGLWSCFNPKGRFYKSFELPTNQETIVERIIERHDTVVVTEMGPVQYVQNEYNEYNYYPTQYETYNNSYGNTGWQPVAMATPYYTPILPVCVPGVGGYIAVSAGFYGWGVSAGFGFDPCFRAQISIGGGYQYYYPNCPQVQQAVCNYVQQTSNNTNIVINNTINNTNTVVVNNTPIVQTPRPIPTTTGVNTGGSGTNPTDSTNTTGGGDFPGSGDNTGGGGTGGNNTGGSGKTDETNGDDLVYTGEHKQKQMNNTANEFSQVRLSGFEKPNTVTTRVNNVNSQELGDAIADYQRTHGGQKPTNVYTEVKPDGGVIYRMNNKPVDANSANLAYTTSATRTSDVNQMGNGQSYTNGTTQTREFSNNNPTVFTNRNTQQRDFSNSSPTVFTNGTTQVRNWDNNPQGFTTASNTVRTFDANQMNNTGYTNGTTQVRTFDNGPQVLSSNTQQRDWNNNNQPGGFNTTNSQPREFNVNANQGQNFNATNNSVRTFGANQMNGASTFNTSGNNVRSSGATQMSNSSPSGMVQQQRTGSPSVIRIR